MSEFRSFRVEAVIIRHSDYGEADRLLTLYSRQQGKLRALAKGARKVTSRKAGHLEPFTHVSLQLARSRDLPIVTQAETLEAFLSLRKDLILTGHASYILELVDRFTYIDETDNSSIFKLVSKAQSSGFEIRSMAGIQILRIGSDCRVLAPAVRNAPTATSNLAEDQYFSAQAV
jgi:DNA repair protein RecO (recombination protein O)